MSDVRVRCRLYGRRVVDTLLGRRGAVPSLPSWLYSTDVYDRDAEWS